MIQDNQHQDANLLSIDPILLYHYYHLIRDAIAPASLAPDIEISLISLHRTNVRPALETLL